MARNYNGLGYKLHPHFCGISKYHATVPLDFHLHVYVYVYNDVFVYFQSKDAHPLNPDKARKFFKTRGLVGFNKEKEIKGYFWNLNNDPGKQGFVYFKLDPNKQSGIAFFNREKTEYCKFMDLFYLYYIRKIDF